MENVNVVAATGRTCAAAIASRVLPAPAQCADEQCARLKAATKDVGRKPSRWAHARRVPAHRGDDALICH